MARRVGPRYSRIGELEALKALCDAERWAIIEALVHRILAVQAEADEAQLLAMVAYVEALLLERRRPH